jgi:hypothetical protein
MTAPTEPETMIPSTEPKTEIETLPVPLPPPTAPPTEVESIVPTEVESAVPTEPETLPVPPQPPIFPDNSNVVGFLNSEDWSGTIYCYYWSDTNKAMTVWPGEPMLKDYYNSIDGKEIYWYALPKDATYVIFTNGSMQTVDIWYNAHEMYIPTTKDSKGHYNVKTR